MRPTTALGTGSSTPAGTAARHLVPLIEELLGGRLPLKLRAWGGSSAGSGPEDGPVVVPRSRRALRRLLWQPDELGLAQAYRYAR